MHKMHAMYKRTTELAVQTQSIHEHFFFFLNIKVKSSMNEESLNHHVKKEAKKVNKRFYL